MEKIDMRQWVSVLEEMVDRKLIKWKKDPKMENGEAVQLRWQFELTHIVLDIFWQDKKEALDFFYHSPRADYNFRWDGLTASTYNKVQDRVGNLAMSTMHPPIDHEAIGE